MITHIEPQSLAKLWNQLVLRTPTEKAIILNDDLTLSPLFRRELESSSLLDNDIGLINSSWSHFLISRSIIENIGWFDERFPGVGNEDEDYEARLAVAGCAIPIVRLHSVHNLIYPTTDFSYGKNVATANSKYIAANKEFFDRKWHVVPESLPGHTWVRILNAFAKLRDGMETPNFHPDRQSVCSDT